MRPRLDFATVVVWRFVQRILYCSLAMWVLQERAVTMVKAVRKTGIALFAILDTAPLLVHPTQRVLYTALPAWATKGVMQMRATSSLAVTLALGLNVPQTCGAMN
jgi:hypothetical protein